MKEVAHKFNSTVLISFISLNCKVNELKKDNLSFHFSIVDNEIM